MPDPKLFTAFNFRVEITVPGLFDDDVCEAAFSDCDGLEMTMAVRTFQEGGNNTQQVQLAGPVSYGQVTLKRGMSADFGLWRWFQELMKTDKRGLRGQASIVMLGADGSEQATFALKDCIPLKLKGPALSAREGVIAIEEMQIAYAALELKMPGVPS